MMKDSTAATVIYTPKAKEFRTMQAALLAAPDVRDETVMKTKWMINSGIYRINSQRLAHRMIQEVFSLQPMLA